MKALKFFFLSLAVLNFTACAFDKNTNTDKTAAQRDHDLLVQSYEQVTGLYRGTVTTPDGAQSIDLSIYWVDVPNGSNSDGSTRYTAKLRARYRRTDIVTTDAIMEATYSPEKTPPEIAMTNFTGEPSVDVNNYSILSYVYGDTIQGTVKTGAGPLGQLNVKLVTKDYNVPEQGDTNEQNDRLVQLYQPLVGNYVGTVSPPASVAASFGVNLSLSISWQKDPTDQTGKRQIPALSGVFQRTYDSSGDYPTLQVDYVADTTPPTLNMVADGSTRGSTNFEKVVIHATIQNGVIQGTFQGNDRRAYPFMLNKR